ncbi:GAF domain-containing protein [Arthrobacter sp. PvP102]|uniref:GAF and ANTAR domain-containing protein n=1 Tax=unclassified Arthrobacter TaxID=235627 RepID=UPI001AEB98AC|nr:MULTISPECIES: GAF and ANTAR domain-containing protein [unclassified Arthrobacter]MBP1232477.1 GAF domain-containing protein [Arthrobacter sp. PvP103]MBP1237612.1 GAF domain-containing protein [Arthrobacter sp. PvP102]
MTSKSASTREPVEQPRAAGAGLAGQLGDLARDLQQEQDTEVILRIIVHAALELIPHVSEASISLVTGRRTIESRAASGELPVKIDALQSEMGQGPCLEAAYDERVVRVPDLANDKRWPGFAQAAYNLGARSMLSIQLFVEGDKLGALNLYGQDVNVFDDESEQIALLVAAHAAIAFSDAKEIAQLTQALDTRDLIGQAKGILMERFKITPQQAFLVLTKASSESNMKLRDVAEHLASSGEIVTRRK